MQNHHVIEICHAANGRSPVTVYAHCTCEWKSSRYQLTGTKFDGTDVAVLAAEHAGREHIEQASASRF